MSSTPIHDKSGWKRAADDPPGSAGAKPNESAGPTGAPASSGPSTGPGPSAGAPRPPAGDQAVARPDVQAGAGAAGGPSPPPAGVQPAPAAGGQSAPAPEDQLEQLRQQLAAAQEACQQAQAELAAANEAKLRALAELENFRRRTQRQMEEERRYALFPLVRDMLPVLDNLRRAIDSAQKSSDAAGLLAGVQLVYKQLQDVLQRHHCVEIEALGVAFDPNLHQAVGQMPTTEHPPGTILEVAQPGFRLHDRVVRPSLVVVAAAPAEQTSVEPSQGDHPPQPTEKPSSPTPEPSSDGSSGKYGGK